MPVTRADEMDALAERVEKLTGPDREIDALIYESVVGLRQYESIDRDSGNLRLRYYPGSPGPEYGRLPRYTASLDAAMALVPEGHLWRCGYSRHVPHSAEVVDYASHKGTFIGESDFNRALALTAACLRAQASIIREAGR